MRFITCFTVTIFLLGLQTALTAKFSMLRVCFDLLIPFIVFLILMRPRIEIWLVIVAAGIGVNMMSGAPIGAYLITYIWLFILFKNVKSFFHTPDLSLFIILVMIGVVLEQIIFYFFHMLHSPEKSVYLNVFYLSLMQIFLVGALSPVFFSVFKKIFYVADKLTFHNE
jgi:hypothetical protein